MLLQSNPPEADFWAGFIAADGSIRYNRPTLTLGIQARDISFLQSFATWVHSDHKIGHYIGKNGHKSVILSFHSPEILADLKTYYGIVSRKSLTLQPPPRKSLAFVSGYWMGDGHIEFSSQGNWTMGFVGTPIFLSWVRSCFTDISISSVRAMNATWRLTYGGNRLVPKIMSRLAAHTPFWVERKFNLYKEMRANLGL